MDVIFLDTNQLRNEKPNRFFGNVDKYKGVAELVRLAIPAIVFDEIIEQKRRHLKAQLEKYRTNYFAELVGDSMLRELEAHIEERIRQLLDGCHDELGHEVIELDPNGKLQLMRVLATKNLAPFDAGTDKGFKDAYIYYTILQSCETTDDDVFLITGDGRLADALKGHPKVTVLKSIEDYFANREEYFKGDYFLGILRDEFEDEGISTTSVVSITRSDDDDWVLEVVSKGEHYTVDVDFASKEIIGTAKLAVIK